MRSTHAPTWVEGPTTTVTLVFDVMEQEETLIPQMNAEQFCELGRKLLPVTTMVAFRYAAAGLMLEIFGDAITNKAAAAVDTVPTVSGFANVIETEQLAGCITGVVITAAVPVKM